jgi:hypothetical protein
MTSPTKIHKWHKMDEIAASELTKVTETPGVVYPVPITLAPTDLQQIKGAVSYYVSGYITPIVMQQGLTIGGEQVIERTEGELTKEYNFVFATSSDSNVYYNGPYKNFVGHHLNDASSVPIKSLFGHSPFNKPEIP